MSSLKAEIFDTLVGKQVLVLWGPGCSPEDIETLSRSLSKTSKLTLENVERLALGIIL